MKRTLAIVSVLALLATALVAVPAVAAEPHKLTFSGSVHVPGATLGPGTYLFTPIAMRVVQVTSTDHKTVYATFMTLPRFRAEVMKEHVVVFGEAPLDVSPPVNIWFPGFEHYGHEFVYTAEHARTLDFATR